MGKTVSEDPALEHTDGGDETPPAAEKAPLWGQARRIARRARRFVALPWEAKAEVWRDSLGLPARDPGPELVIRECVGWLFRAQDASLSHDGGVARHYGLDTGWSESYPETTGYVIPTLLDFANSHHDLAGRVEAHSARERARRMLDWLLSLQFPGGGFPGGTITQIPHVPVVFNTGQILMGLAAGVREFGHAYRPAMRRAADWLVGIQDADGCWRAHESPFAYGGEKTYDAHTAWGLLEAARLDRDPRYSEAAKANIDWVLTKQRDNGWFEKGCLTDPQAPLTHCIGYTMRGILELYRYAGGERYLRAARRMGDALVDVQRRCGFVPGRLDASWEGTVSWACLTGNAQIACCWLMLYEETGDRRYLDAALAENVFVRRTVKVDGPPQVRGGVKGSFPVSGGYGRYKHLNWACKFVIDANLMELDTRTAE